MLSVINIRKLYKFGNPVVAHQFIFSSTPNHFTEILDNATDLTMGTLFTDLLNDVDVSQR